MDQGTNQGPATIGTIPQSQALSEAGGPESLSDLMSRDPEGFQRQDLDRIIEAMRAQRRRLAEAEAQGRKPGRGIAGPRASETKALETSASTEDLWL